MFLSFTVLYLFMGMTPNTSFEHYRFSGAPVLFREADNRADWALRWGLLVLLAIGVRCIASRFNFGTVLAAVGRAFCWGYVIRGLAANASV